MADEAAVAAAPPLLLDVEPDVAALSSEGGYVSGDIRYALYRGEVDLPGMAALFAKDLSEPYSVFTYRYFVHQWPHLCILVRMYLDLCSVYNRHSLMADLWPPVVNSPCSAHFTHAAALQAFSGDTLVGSIVCKEDKTRKERIRGYVAMLAVDKLYRKHGIGASSVSCSELGLFNGLFLLLYA